MKKLLYLIPVGFLFACVAIGGVALNQALSMRGRSFPGFFVQENAAVSPIRRAHWPDSNRGLVPGERVLALDGISLQSGHDFAAKFAGRPPGQAVDITLANGQVTRFTLRQLSPQDFAATFIFPFSVGVLYLLVGTFIFFAKRTYAAGLLLSICIVAAAFHMTTFDAQTTYRLARVWVAYPLLGAVALHLFSVFPEVRPAMHRLLPLGLSYAVAFSLVAARQLVHTNALASETVALIAAFYLAGAFIGCTALLLRTRRSANTQQVRNKARVLLWGLIVTVAASVAWVFIVRVWPDALTVERVMMASSFFPLLIGYATLKHDLFDMDALLRTTLTYGTVTALVGCLYAAVVAGTGLAAARAGLVGTVAGAVALTLALSLVIQPARVRVQRLVDRMLFRERLDLTEALRGLIADLASIDSLEALGERILPRVARLVGAQGAAVFVAEGAEFIDGVQWAAQWGVIDPAIRTDPNRASLCLPLRATGETVGLLVLGAKHRPDVYTPAESEALREVLPAMAAATRMAMLLRAQASRERLATLGEVAAILIHDFKNPLGILKVSIGTLKKRLQSDGVAKELADCMDQEVDRMNQTSVQLLHFARPQPAEVGVCDLREIVLRTLERIRPQMDAAHIRTSVRAEQAVPCAADSVAMERVLCNLLDNARAAMLQGGELRVSLQQTQNQTVELVVEDTGIGMDEATRARIFQPFFTTRPGGTGLGLAIVRQILDAHHASIDVESALQKGTTVRIRFSTSADTRV